MPANTSSGIWHTWIVNLRSCAAPRLGKKTCRRSIGTRRAKACSWSIGTKTRTVAANAIRHYAGEHGWERPECLSTVLDNFKKEWKEKRRGALYRGTRREWLRRNKDNRPKSAKIKAKTYSKSLTFWAILLDGISNLGQWALWATAEDCFLHDHWCSGSTQPLIPSLVSSYYSEMMIRSTWPICSIDPWWPKMGKYSLKHHFYISSFVNFMGVNMFKM